jgi:hypothetical protein
LIFKILIVFNYAAKELRMIGLINRTNFFLINEIVFLILNLVCKDIVKDLTKISFGYILRIDKKIYLKKIIKLL